MSQPDRNKRGVNERWAAWAAFVRTALGCGASWKEKWRLFYLAGVKRSLVHHRLATHRPEQILRYSIRCDDRQLTLHLRDNALDVATFIEFFSPETVTFPRDLPQYRPEVLYDIGANVGIASLFFMCKYPRARILAFEPVTANLEICALNLANSSAASGFPWAIGAQSGTAAFEFDTADLRGGSIGALPRAARGTLRRVDVPVFSLADLVTVKQMPAPDFVKIDVEGAEMDVFRGMGKASESIQVIVVETHGPELEKDVRHWLKAHGFTVRHCYEASPGFCTIWGDRL